MSGSQMRASHMQSNVACLGILSEGMAIRGAYPELIAPVESALRVSWLPIELNSALIEKVEATCGAGESRKWVHASIRRSMLGTLLKPVVDGLTRLGLGPQHGLRRCEYGWNLLYKNAGRIECTRAEVGEATLILSGAPKCVLSPSYLRALAFAFEGIAMELGGIQATANFERGRDAKFEVRWKIRT